MPVTTTFSVGQILTASEMTLLASPPLFVGYQNTSQPLASGAWTKIVIDTNVVDTYNGHSVITNPSRYTAQVAGWYQITGGCAFGINASGQRAVTLFKNGTQVLGAQVTAVNVGSSADPMPQTTFTIQMAVGDYVEVGAYQDCGGSLGSLGSGFPSLQARWVHA